MDKILKNIGFNEFLELVSGIAIIKKHTILLNYEDEIIGTLDEFKELSKQIKNIDLKRVIHQLGEKSTIEFSEIDIANYLQNITNNFQKESVELCISEIDVFENIVFYDLINTKALNEYSRNNWDIPTIEKINRKTKEIYVTVNFKEMRNKLFPFVGFQLEFAKQFLKRKLNSEIEENTIKPPFKDVETKPIDKLTTPEKTPFRDQQTKDLFEYIVEKWKYNRQQKWADIFININATDGYAIPYKNDYQAYIIQRFGYTGKFQYDKLKKANNRNYKELMELIEKFSKK